MSFDWEHYIITAIQQTGLLAYMTGMESMFGIKAGN